MYRIITLFSISIFILFGNTSFAIDKGTILPENSSHAANTQANITHAQIIENETIKFQKKLIKIQKNYTLLNDKTIKNHLKNLNEIIYILKKIQTTKVYKNTADNVIKTVISDLKNINTQVKSYLYQFQKIDQDRIIKYTQLTYRLNKAFDTLLLTFNGHYLSKEKISISDKKILEELQKIRILNISLKNLTNRTYVYSSHYKDSIITIIKKFESVYYR